MILRVAKLFLFLSALQQTSFSQTHMGCGTIATARDIEVLKSLNAVERNAARSFDTMTDDQPIYIAITPHIVRRSDGTGGLQLSTLEEAMEYLNESYEGTSMRFFILGDVRYIDNDDYFDFDSSNEGAITSPNNVPNTINIYFYNSLTSQGANLCGYAYFPETGRDHIMMANGCTNSSTFPHEVGHYFALYHTHGKTNTGTTDELVNGSNCSTTGDDVCDTPADPNLTGLVNGSCEYTGSALDVNNDVFVPNPRNFMSYSRSNCRGLFTDGQKERMVAAYQQFKTYLVSKDFTADFRLESSIVCEGEQVQFENRSIGAISYLWEFEGGTPASSTEESPLITYSTEGKYDVKLSITDAGQNTSEIELESRVVVRALQSTEITEKAGSFEEEVIEEEILNEDNSVTFKKSSRATDGSGSVFIEFMNYRTIGAEDYLIFGNLDTQGQKFFELTFDYAYAPYDASFYDGLAIVYREACGEWITAWEKSGEELQTSPAQQSLFRPDEDQWSSAEIQFEIPAEFTAAEFAFKSINGFGNALYVDNYNIYVDDPTFDISGITVSDASCPDSADGSISVSTFGSEVLQFSVNDGAYSSSNTFEGLVSGEYTCNVKNGAEFVKSQVVTVGANDEYPSAQNIVLLGDFLTINTVPGQTIQWYLNDVLLDGENSASLTNPQRGSYTVTVANGACATTSGPFVILSSQGEENFEVYPNPTSDQLNLIMPREVMSKVQVVKITDLTGKDLKTLNTDPQSVNVESLKSGIYFVEVIGKDFSFRKRFLKK